MYKQSLKNYQKAQDEAMAQRLNAVVNGKAKTPNVIEETQYIWAKSSKSGHVTFDVVKENLHEIFLNGDGKSEDTDTQFTESVTIYVDAKTKEPITGRTLIL